jgi:hypothetical protein
MIVFNVVKEQYGWAVRTGDCMTTPFRSKELAVQEANCLADGIRCHGESAEVIVEGVDPTIAARMIKRRGALRLAGFLHGGWAGLQ